MNKQNMSKIQTCVLRMNVHCDGCKDKIRKKLKKIEGVYGISIDVEQGKVSVSGDVDPATLIKKLEKAGKHAEFWGPHRGPTSAMNSQLKNIQIGKDSKTQKGGFQDVRILGKDQKSVKFSLPEEEEDDDFDDDDDEEEFDDEFDEGFAGHKPPTKGAHGPQAKKATSNGHPKGQADAKNGGKGKKGGGLGVFFRGILGKAGGKKGNSGKTHSKTANQKGGGKKGDKNGTINGKGAAHKNYDDNWSKKVGHNLDGGPKLQNKQLELGFHEINTKHRGGGGGGGGNGGPMGQRGNFHGGNTDPMGQMGSFRGMNTGPMGQMGNFHGGNMGPMGQMGNFEAMRGLPPAINVGNFQGNPYYQQYMAHMMMMNQQREDAYMRSQPFVTSYGPPPATDQYTHIFSDENTGSCSIM